MTISTDALHHDNLARRIERHEALGWAAQIDAATQGNNPLGAVLSTSGPTPLSALTALNFAAFNRVVGLGADRPVTEEDIASILDFYAGHQQTRFIIETTPQTAPEVIEWLRERHLVPQPQRVAKNVHLLHDLPPRPEIDIVPLSSDDQATIASVNCQAWGLPRMFRSWFGAPITARGFHYYGVRDEGAIVAVAMLYVDGDLAWSSDSATLPSHQGRGYHRALQLHRLYEARGLGAQWVHTENVVEAPTFDSASYHNNRKLGFVHLYDKVPYGPDTSSASASAVAR